MFEHYIEIFHRIRFNESPGVYPGIHFFKPFSISFSMPASMLIVSFFSGGLVERPGHSINAKLIPHYYSLLKLLTGLVNAALMAWKLMVKKAISKASTAARINTHGEI